MCAMAGWLDEGTVEQMTVRGRGEYDSA